MNTAELPDHLGGHLNKTHTDRVTLLYLKDKYNIKSMVDVGCGPGDMTNIAKMRGIDAMGVDGDFTLVDEWKRKGIDVVLHDFSTGAPEIDKEFDLAWSVEFLEHLYEEYIPNFMSVFEKANYVICTAAPPGYPGHHHVNCQPQEYWIEKFAEYGFEFDAEETAFIRANSAMQKPFMQATGMFFRKRND
jgi:trans-aconitate methyltransferase